MPSFRDKTVSWAGFYRRRAPLIRLDVAPFALAYSILHASAWSAPQAPLWVLIALPIALLLHVLTHLLTHWSVACNAFIAYTKVNSRRFTSIIHHQSSSLSSESSSSSSSCITTILIIITIIIIIIIIIIITHPPIPTPTTLPSPHLKVKTVRQATHVRARPPPNSGAEEVVPLQLISPDFSSSSSSSGSITLVSHHHSLPHARFNFQKTIFCYPSPDAQAHEFQRLSYPIEGKITAFLESKGYRKNEEAVLALSIWGENIFDIPLPPFADLFKVREAKECRDNGWMDG